MPFEEGTPKPEGSGRKAGTPNKRTQTAREIAARLGFCPVEAMIHWAKGDWKSLGYESGTKTIFTAEGAPIEVDVISAELRQKSAKDVFPYLYPQLKAIEHSGDAGALAAGALTQILANALAAKEPDAGNGGTEPSAGT